MYQTMKARGKEFAKGFSGWTLPGLGGMALISYGVSLIYFPAGLIVGGIFLVGLWLDSRL